MKRKPLTLLRDVALALTSLAVGLTACELALRLYYPRYELAANPPPSPQDRDARPTSRSVLRLLRSGRSHTHAPHPDTGVEHRMIYNEVGARTSRSFTEESLAETVNIAFFGDSMTENIHLPVQYGFTEHLDYLLNHLPTGWQPTRHADPAATPHFNVLNFGVWGWTTAREYLRWRRISAKRTFDHVFYVFHRNDVSDLPNQIAYGTISLDESGNVQRGDSTSVPAWKRLIAHLQLTYLAIDAWKRLAGEATGNERERADDGDERLALLDARSVVRKLVLRWKREVEAGGGRFHVVVLPTPNSQWMFGTLGLSVLHDDLDVLDLLDCFQAHIPDYKDGYKAGDWRLRNDPHWNPAANMIAASCLYRYLEDVLDLPPRTDEALAAARHTYYQAFLDAPNWEGERFAPAAPWVPPAASTAPVLQADSEAIVNHYLAVEIRQSTERGSDIVAAAREAGVLAAADWNVFANLPERLLMYTQAPCKETHDAAVRPFFLHVYPFTREKLSDLWRPYGYQNLDRGPWLRRQDSDECVFMVRLPEWPVAYVRTGQFTASDAGGETVYEKHWEVHFAFPLAHSVWDVYAAKGGRRVLDYVKRPCPQAARQARFFLHVYPLRASDLPSTFSRYVNRDFQWNAAAGGHYDAAEDSCRVSAVLPDFPIDTIHTGQFRDGLIDERLWDVRIRLAETERLAQQDG